MTQQDEAYLHGDKVKKNEQNELFINHAKYTTCNLEDPHFHIAASKLKVIPDNKIVSGPFVLKVNDVPTPLAFPFGMFPAPKKNASGIVFPQFGEERLRGFFLRDGGYYWAISDYIDLKLLGEIYSKGSRGVKALSTYKKRYKYSGNFSFHYISQTISVTEGGGVQNDFRVNWSHAPQTRKNSRFTASVNAGSNSYRENNVSQNPNENINSTFNSNITYNKQFGSSPFSLTATMRHTQDIDKKLLSIDLPVINLGMQSIYPFHFKNIRSGGRHWIQRTNLSYAMNASNKLTNRLSADSIMPFNTETLPIILDKGVREATHAIPISTSIPFLKILKLNPRFSYNEKWKDYEINYQGFDEQNNVFIGDTIPGFSRSFSYSTGAALNSEMLSGTFFFKSEQIQALRHTLVPSLSFNYSPNFTPALFGQYQELSKDGEQVYVSKYNFGSLGNNRESKSLNLSLNNTLQMKVKDLKDTVKQSKKVYILKSLNFNTSYNLDAEQYKLSPFRVTAATSLWDGKVNLNMSSLVIDPYIYELEDITVSENGKVTVTQQKLDEFAWNVGQGIGQISSAVFNISTRLTPPGAKSKPPTPTNQEQENVMEDMQQNPNLYVDFSMPWSLNISFNLNYTKTGHQESVVRKTLTFNGDISLTDKWKITFGSGYDLETNNILSTTNISILRDLHCWELAASWTPIGYYTNYNIDLRVKATVLQDLKLSRRRSNFDSRF